MKESDFRLDIKRLTDPEIQAEQSSVNTMIQRQKKNKTKKTNKKQTNRNDKRKKTMYRRRLLLRNSTFDEMSSICRDYLLETTTETQLSAIT